MHFYGDFGQEKKKHYECGTSERRKQQIGEFTLKGPTAIISPMRSRQGPKIWHLYIY